MNYEYSPFSAANYAAFSPIAWCMFFAWAVFTSHLGYRNVLVDVLSWRGFRVTTKLSYAIYLTQFPIFFFQVGRVRTSIYYEFFSNVMFDFNEYGVIFLSSFLLTVLFETPFSNIKRLLFERKRKKTPVPSSTHPADDKPLVRQLNIDVNSSKTIIYTAAPVAKELKDR